MPSDPALGVSDTIATRIVIEGSRARGVEIVRDGIRETIWAEREIILCGGTVNSPQLLMLSGIGPADHLSHLDIPVVVDAPEVGRNLQNHPSYALRFACSQPVTAYKYLNPRAALGIGLRYAISRGGSLAAAGEVGFSVVDDLDADVAEGFGRFDTNIADGRRASTAVAYVQPARRRGNLELLSETEPAWPKWSWRAACGSLLAGMCWGLGGLVLFPTMPVLGQIFLAFVIAGLSAGAQW